jgi:hypothetical protein
MMLLPLAAAWKVGFRSEADMCSEKSHFRYGPLADFVQGKTEDCRSRRHLNITKLTFFAIPSDGDSACSDFCLVLWGVGFRAIRRARPGTLNMPGRGGGRIGSVLVAMDRR